jgi:NAD(P)-dependent dehydrogenase (short-subunit alcohol dehydrogenase family)
MKTIIILGINADIGKNLAKLFIIDGYKVIGTYRKKKPANLAKADIYKCDITKKKDIAKFITNLKRKKIKWDIIFSSVGTSEPISKFFDINFDIWRKSINVNFISQLEVIHFLYKLRSNNKNSIVLMAGGGTNNPFKNYSAYCVSKIALIKMCELIDDEYKNLNTFIIGPGFTKTKTHLETIKAGKKAGTNYLRVKKFLKSSNQGTSFKKIYECILWGTEESRKIVGGRNFSVVHDKWGTKRLRIKLLSDINKYKLRRHKN